MPSTSDLFEMNVSSDDSGLMHRAPANGLSAENLHINLAGSENDFFETNQGENQPADANFDFSSNSFSSEAEPLISEPDSRHPSLEQLIQDSVSRSTARLLTKNALKYLDRDLMVTQGDGSSHQFTFASPNRKEAPKPAYPKRGDSNPPVAPKEVNRAGSKSPVQVDPGLSDLKMQTLTHEMQKLFDNIKSFELNARGESMVCNVDSNVRFSLNSSLAQPPLTQSGSLNPTYSIVTDTGLFASRMKSEPFQSLSRAVQDEPLNPATSNSNEFAQGASFNASTKASDSFDKSQEPASEDFSESPDTPNFNVDLKYAAPPKEACTEDENLSAFNTAKSRTHTATQRTASKFPCFSCQTEGHSPDSAEPQEGAQEAALTVEKPFPEPQQQAPSFNPPFVTRVYAPFAAPEFLPKKRAVVVGCNYVGMQDAQLRGSCNDAFAFAQVLVKKFNFDPKNVVLLLDSRPSPSYTRNLSQSARPNLGYNPGPNLNLDLSRARPAATERNAYPTKKTSMFGRHLLERDLKHLGLNENVCLDYSTAPAPTEMLPTRGNIFRSLKWLNFSSSPNDLAVFYFSGHSVQVDDLSGYEGDGFDEALVPCDYERSGLVTCNDLRCLFQSIGATCRLNVFFDACNLQTVVGGASRSGPVKGSMMKGLWPFSEPTGKLQPFVCSDSVFKDQAMMNQMTRVKFIPTLQVDSLSCLSDVQMSLDATHGVVNYVVLSSSNLKGVSVECLFKPLNLDAVTFSNPSNKWTSSHMVRDDEVVVHGAFTYALLLTLLHDKANRRGGLGVDEVVEGVNKKLVQLRKLRLPKLNQQCQSLFYHSAKIPAGGFLFPAWLANYQVHAYANNAFGFLLPGDAWMLLVDHGRQRAREHQEKFERMKTDLITMSNLSNKLYNAGTARTNLPGSLTNPNTPQSLKPAVTARSRRPVEVTVKPVVAPSGTGRSLTNNLSARVFSRNPSVTGRRTSRSKTAEVNDLGPSAREAQSKPFDYEKVSKEALLSHNWYGGCTVATPYNKAAYPDALNQPTWYSTYTQYQDPKFDDTQAYYGGQFYTAGGNTLPVYEPITAAMLQQLPTSRSFSVLQR